MVDSPFSFAGGDAFPLDGTVLETGKSSIGDLKEALKEALFKSKEKLTSNDIEWMITAIRGRDSDFINEIEVTVAAKKAD